MKNIPDDKLEQNSKKKDLDEIFNLMKENKIQETIDYVEQNKLKVVDCEDEHGTTPLQYASYRGYYDLCKLLINKGADVNAKTHDQGYTALMFAAISNHKEVVKLLLEHEADMDYTNTIGRNSVQMAAFVNSIESVDIMKGHLSKKSLEYFTEKNSISETEPKLPKGECFEELYKILSSSINYSPVRILKSISLSKNNVLLDNIEKVIRTLDAFISKAFKYNEFECPNDILSFKLHHYKYIFEYLLNSKKSLQIKQEKLENSELNKKLFEISIKRFLSEEEIYDDTSQKKKMCRLFEEKFLRELIRQFPYKDCGILHQMVTVLSKTAIGAYPPALTVITTCLNGQRFGQPSENSKREILECATCTFKSEDAKWCTHCRNVAYCDQYCQRLHWSLHKKENKTNN